RHTDAGRAFLSASTPERYERGFGSIFGEPRERLDLGWLDAHCRDDSRAERLRFLEVRRRRRLRGIDDEVREGPRGIDIGTFERALVAGLGRAELHRPIDPGTNQGPREIGPGLACLRSQIEQRRAVVPER